MIDYLIHVQAQKHKDAQREITAQQRHNTGINIETNS